jgi:hypothetical protein
VDFEKPKLDSTSSSASLHFFIEVTRSRTPIRLILRWLDSDFIRELTCHVGGMRFTYTATTSPHFQPSQHAQLVFVLCLCHGKRLDTSSVIVLLVLSARVGSSIGQRSLPFLVGRMRMCLLGLLESLVLCVSLRMT